MPFTKAPLGAPASEAVRSDNFPSNFHYYLERIELAIGQVVQMEDRLAAKSAALFGSFPTATNDEAAIDKSLALTGQMTEQLTILHNALQRLDEEINRITTI